MRILLTGGAGYIGSHIAFAALIRGHQLEIVDSLVRGKVRAVERAATLAGTAPPPLHAIDLCDSQAITEVLSRNFDVIIHCAGFKSVSESVQHPDRYERNNVRATRVLAEAAQRKGTTRMVFSSTGCIYGDRLPPPFQEDAPLDPGSPYATSKVDCEEFLTTLPGSFTVLRFFNVCGAHASGELGEYPGFTTNLMPILVDQLDHPTPTVTVFGDDYPTEDGTCIRDYIHVMDIANANVLAAERVSEPGVTTFNVGTGRGSSVFEVIRAVERAAGIPFDIQIGPRRPGDAVTLVADPARIAKRLDWTAAFDLDDMARHAVSWARTLSRGQA